MCVQGYVVSGARMLCARTVFLPQRTLRFQLFWCATNTVPVLFPPKKEVPPVAAGTSHGVHATITLCAPHKTQQREVNHHPAHPNVHPAQTLRCPMCLAAGGNFRKLSGHPLASHCTRSAVPQQLQLYYKLYEGLIRPAQRCHIHACNDVYHV